MSPTPASSPCMFKPSKPSVAILAAMFGAGFGIPVEAAEQNREER